MPRRLTRAARLRLGTLECRTAPATFTVTNTLDGFGVPGSLRQAVDDANALAGADSIVFDPIVFAAPTTITLTKGYIRFRDALTVTGPQAKLTLDGNQGNIFYIYSLVNPYLPMAISGLALTNARDAYGGAIYLAYEDLALSNVTISNCHATNSGGAIYVDQGSLNLTDCSLTGNSADGTLGYGGAIYGTWSSDVTVTRTTIANGSAAVNAVLVEGKLTITDSTISGNVGGGVFALNGTLRNCTIVDNVGVAVEGVKVLLQSCTVAFNSKSPMTGGGGGVSGSNIMLESTIVAKNAADIIGGKITANFCLIGNPGGVAISGANNLLNVDPLLGALAANGGPTLTAALLPGSPAVNAGSNPAVLAFDQRGLPRVAGAAPDIGAFEVQPPPRVTAVMINGGAAQRSRVTTLAVAFDQVVTLPPAPADAFTLVRQGGGPVTLAAAADHSGPGTVVTLTFTGGPVNGASLADGRYTLAALASKVANANGSLDGNGDGTGGDDYVLASSGAAGVFRLFGDADGDADVDAADFGAFRPAFGGSTNLAYDSDGDGDVDAADFGQFRGRFGTNL